MSSGKQRQANDELRMLQPTHSGIADLCGRNMSRKCFGLRPFEKHCQRGSGRGMDERQATMEIRQRLRENGGITWGSIRRT